MSEQETQAVEPQESRSADDAELQELHQAVQEAGLEGATVTKDGEDGFKISLRPNGDEIYPQSLVINVSRNMNPKFKLPPGFMAQKLREQEANARLYATGRHPAQGYFEPMPGEWPKFPDLSGIDGISGVKAVLGSDNFWRVDAMVGDQLVQYELEHTPSIFEAPHGPEFIAGMLREQAAALSRELNGRSVIAVAHLHAAQALPEVGPDADLVPDCVYEGIELFKAEDRRTMRVVLVRDLGLAAQEVPEQPAEEA